MYMHTLYIPLGFDVHAVRANGVPSLGAVQFQSSSYTKSEQEATILYSILYKKSITLIQKKKKNEQNFSTWASALWNVCYLLFQSIFKRCSNFNLLTQFHNHFILSANWCFQKNCLFRFINEFSSKINSFTEKLRIKSKSYHSLFN